MITVKRQFSVGVLCVCTPVNRDAGYLCSGCLYRDVCREQPWKAERGSLSRAGGRSALKTVSSSMAKLKQICLLTMTEDSSSLHSGFLFSDATWANVTWPSSCHPVGTGSQGIGTNADTLAAAVAVSNKLPFVFDPGILCLLPASMKLCQANLLVCN